ncbi:zeta toxin family protein [Sulfurospirillum oryzae]|uniref:zeta toxin family protein n=1 Tax=Sulfurospirillum oryzae TaxID=2976535 RepID=UPI0021E9A73C|nr:zeta toxin family protein [Sulfurospirillum oryzae]
MKDYSRPLHEIPLAYDFLTRVLKLAESEKTGDKALKITTAEQLLKNAKTKSTLNDDSVRHPSYMAKKDRQKLRTTIFEELITQKRLDNDDNIKLGDGGALPKSDLKFESQAFIIIGLPAAGKSTIAEKIADTYGACILDSDYAKRKFPEFTCPHGASIVHEESSLVILGDDKMPDELSVKEYMILQKANIIIPKIGYNVDSIKTMRDYLISKKYKVHLILVSVDKETSTKRALDRFVRTDRYVPLALIFDTYSNDPMLTYYRLKDCENWGSIGKISTEGEHPEVIYNKNNSPVEIWSIKDE